jgi:hypothetical protein
MSVAGGGLMVDADVMNNGLKPEDIRLDIGFHTLDPDGVPCAVFGTPGDYDLFCERVIEWPRDRFDVVQGRPHVSDMYLMKWWSKPRSDQCVEYGKPGWESAPLIHFASSRIQSASSGHDKFTTIYRWRTKKLIEKPAVPGKL